MERQMPDSKSHWFERDNGNDHRVPGLNLPFQNRTPPALRVHRIVITRLLAVDHYHH